MNNQEYLNQISAMARPKAAGKMNFLSSKWFKIGAIAVGALILIMIIGSMLGSGRSIKEEATALLLHIDGTAEEVSEFQPSLKSSALRSNSASLDSILENTSRELTAFLTSEYNYSPNGVDKNLTADATLHQDGLHQELFEAKINGILDRIFAHKMAYEISLMMTEEAKLYELTNNTTLMNLLSTSYSSLGNLEEQFSGFSEAK